MARKPRKGLATVAAAARLKEGQGAQPVAGGASEEMTTTSINITPSALDVLKAVAFKRSKEEGGRMSVSDVIRTLVEDNIDSLTKEAGPFL